MIDKIHIADDERYCMYHEIIFMGILLIIGFTLISGCSMLLKEPEVSVESIALTDITLTDITLSVNLTIDNPNMFGITFDTITCDASYQNNGQWEHLSHVEIKDIQIEKGMNTVTIPVYAKNMDLLKAGLNLLKNHEINLKIEGIAKPSLFGLAPEIPFTRTELIPLPVL